MPSCGACRHCWAEPSGYLASDKGTSGGNSHGLSTIADQLERKDKQEIGSLRMWPKFYENSPLAFLSLCVLGLAGGKHRFAGGLRGFDGVPLLRAGRSNMDGTASCRNLLFGRWAPARRKSMWTWIMTKDYWKQNITINNSHYMKHERGKLWTLFNGGNCEHCLMEEIVNIV